MNDEPENAEDVTAADSAGGDGDATAGLRGLTLLAARIKSLSVVVKIATAIGALTAGLTGLVALAHDPALERVLTGLIACVAIGWSARLASHCVQADARSVHLRWWMVAELAIAGIWVNVWALDAEFIRVGPTIGLAAFASVAMPIISSFESRITDRHDLRFGAKALWASRLSGVTFDEAAEPEHGSLFKAARWLGQSNGVGTVRWTRGLATAAVAVVLLAAVLGAFGSVARVEGVTVTPPVDPASSASPSNVTPSPSASPTPAQATPPPEVPVSPSDVPGDQTYEGICGHGAESTLKVGLPDWVGHGLYDLVLGDAGPGALVAGCFSSPQVVRGPSGESVVVARGYLRGNLVSIAIDSSVYGPALLLGEPAVTAETMLADGIAFAASPRAVVHGGNLQLLYTSTGTWAFVRSERWGSYVELPPVLVEAWIRAMSDRGTWLSVTRTGDGRFSFVSEGHTVDLAVVLASGAVETTDQSGHTVRVDPPRPSVIRSLDEIARH